MKTTSSMKRAQVLGQHLGAPASAGSSDGGVSASATSAAEAKAKATSKAKAKEPAPEFSLKQLMEMLEDKTKLPDRQQLLEDLPGPVKELGFVPAMLAVQRASLHGHLHHFWNEWSRRSSADGADAGTNFVFPTSVVPKGEVPYIDLMVVLSHPDDAERVARLHVRKGKSYGIAFLGDGVLSTRDIDSWREQREHLVEAFLPDASLKHVFRASADRAEYCVDEKLRVQCEGGRAALDINEFFLFEAMAQLQLALMGESTEYMEETNVPLRQSFKAALKLGGMEAAKERSAARKTVHNYSNGLVRRSVGAHVGVAEAQAHHQPSSVSGPLTARIADVCPHAGAAMDPKVQRDNASTFLFAGHDTTANLMTHVIYWICKHPEWQHTLRAEADAFAKRHPHGNFGVEELKELVQLKMVLFETLRISPSVPSGTFREIQYDETVTGPGGKPVTLAKGTQFVVPVWTLHHNKGLWGDDVEDFNPKREWLPEEIYGSEDAWSASAPQSYRFCPFTFSPRNCIGKAFALNEARIILFHALRNFEFELAPASLGEDGNPLPLEEISINTATLGPKDGLWVYAKPRSTAEMQ